MPFAVVLILLVVGSVLFHILSPWTFTELASNWGMVDFTVDTFGRLDWACNNAARGKFGPFIETTDDEWEKTIATTLGSVFHAMRAQVRVMLEAGSGSIVNISSRTGVTGTALEAA